MGVGILWVTDRITGWWGDCVQACLMRLCPLLQLHVVHWNAEKYQSYQEASGSPEGLAVLAVFLKVGRPKGLAQKDQEPNSCTAHLFPLSSPFSLLCSLFLPLMMWGWEDMKSGPCACHVHSSRVLL